MNQFWDGQNLDWKTYQRSYGEGPEWCSRKWIAERVGPQDSVLEFGAAGGIVYEALKNKYPDIGSRYMGSDYASTAVAACREMFPETSWFEWDVRDKPVKDFSAVGNDLDDVVILSHTLDHVDDYESALRNSWCYVKPGGKMLIILWAATFENEREPSYQDKTGDASFRQYSHVWLKDWMERELGAEVTFEKLKGNVPGREHREDTCFEVTKKV